MKFFIKLITLNVQDDPLCDLQEITVVGITIVEIQKQQATSNRGKSENELDLNRIT